MQKDIFLNLGLLVLRVFLGTIFGAHGLKKVLGLLNLSGIEDFLKTLADIGVSPVIFWAWAVATVEFVGGVFLILGILPRLSAAAIGIVMVVAVITIYGAKSFLMPVGGPEYQLLILAVCLSIILTGAGKFSLFNKF
jgi:putative oxidoreductase